MKTKQKEELEKSLEESVSKGWYCSAAKLARELGRSEEDMEEYEARQKAYSVMRNMLRKKYSWKDIGATLEEISKNKWSGWKMWEDMKPGAGWKYYSQLARKAYKKSADGKCRTNKGKWCELCEKEANEIEEGIQEGEGILKLEYHATREEWAEAAKAAEEIGKGFLQDAAWHYIKVGDMKRAKRTQQAWWSWLGPEHQEYEIENMEALDAVLLREERTKEKERMLKESVAKRQYSAAASLAQKLGRQEEAQQYKDRHEAYCKMRQLLREYGMHKYGCTWEKIGEKLEEEALEYWRSWETPLNGLLKCYAELAIRAYKRAAKESATKQIRQRRERAVEELEMSIQEAEIKAREGEEE